MKIYYKNNMGQSIDFTALPYNLSESDLYDYDWAYEMRGNQTNRIYWFHKAVTEKKLLISVSASSLELYQAAGNHMLGVFEYDIANLTPGRMYVGEYYLSCYIFRSKKTEWVPGVNFLVNELTIVSETGQWIKIEHNNFNGVNQEQYAVDSGLDYPHDYPYDFASETTDKFIYNNNFLPCDFEMKIFGACESPIVSIGNISYEVDTNVGIGEYLVINTQEKKIYKVKIDGEKVNLFHYRSRDRVNFFEKIPAGKQAVRWNGSYMFDIDLFYERSEPVWT